jgi:hypothetical protein
MKAHDTRPGGRHCYQERVNSIPGEAEQPDYPGPAGAPVGVPLATAPAVASLSEIVRFGKPCYREMLRWRAAC